MATSASLLLMRTALVVAVVLPDISAFRYPTDPSDLDHKSSPSLAATVSSSKSFPELIPGMLTLTGSKTSLRAKRISQMSCHCCSNSFNSHCCLKCMQRVGKRSNTFKLPNKQSLLPSFDSLESDTFLAPAEDQSRDNSRQTLTTSDSYDVDGGIAIDESDTLAVTCLCCLNQMRENKVSTWSCCFSCFRKRH